MKKTIKQQVLEAKELLRTMTSHDQLREWAISNGMDNRSAFSMFKVALKEIGIDYDEIKKSKIKTENASLPEEVEEVKKGLPAIAEHINGKVWEKNGMRRIYVTGGNNYHYEGKWWVEFHDDGQFEVKCWLDKGYNNKKADEYIYKHKKMIENDVKKAMADLNITTNDIAIFPKENNETEKEQLPFSEEIEATLKCEPVPIIFNKHYNPRLTPIKSVANLADTSMIEHYRGCGEGFAYVKENKVIAFRYGRYPVSNEPKDAERIPVEMSSTQLCFRQAF